MTPHEIRVEPSAYSERFSRLTDELVVPGGLLLVEKIKEPELKTSSGLVIAKIDTQRLTTHDRKLAFVRVLRSGAGFYDEDTGEDMPLESRPGDIIAVPMEAVTFYSAFGALANYEQDTIGLVSESSAILRIPGGDEGYRRLFEVLNTTHGSSAQARPVGSGDSDQVDTSAISPA